eukprot:SAG31_NODE_154_length_22184_cov_25.917142_9_plen_757_part_00
MRQSKSIETLSTLATNGKQTVDKDSCERLGVYVVVNQAAATRFKEHLGENTPSTTLTVIDAGSLVRVDEIDLTTSGQRRGRTDQGWLSFTSVKGTQLLKPVAGGRPADETSEVFVPRKLRCVSDVAVTANLETEGQREVLITRVVTPGEEAEVTEICSTKAASPVSLRARIKDGWASLVAKNGKILWVDITERLNQSAECGACASLTKDKSRNGPVGTDETQTEGTTATVTTTNGLAETKGDAGAKHARLKPLVGRGMMRVPSAPAKLGQKRVAFGYQRVRVFTESASEMAARRAFWQYVQQQAEQNCRGLKNTDELEDALGKAEVLKRIRDGGRVVTFGEALGNKGAMWLAEGVVDVGARCRNLTLVNCAVGDEGFAAICAILRKSSIRTLILDQNVITDAGILRERPKLTQSKLQNLSVAQNRFTSTSAQALGKAIANNSRGLSKGSVQMSTFVFSMKELMGTAESGKDAAGRLDLARQELDDLDASFIAGVLPSTGLRSIDLTGNRIGDAVMSTLVQILPETAIVDLNISAGAFDPCNCDAAISEVIQAWVGKAGTSATISYGSDPVIAYSGAMYIRGDHPAEERLRCEMQRRLMGSAGEELVGWAIDIGGTIGVVQEYVGFRLFAKSDFHVVDFGQDGSPDRRELSLVSRRDDGLMGLVNFDARMQWTLVGLPGTPRVTRAFRSNQRSFSEVFEQPSAPSPHTRNSLVTSRLSTVSMGSEESQLSSNSSSTPLAEPHQQHVSVRTTEGPPAT